MNIVNFPFLVFVSSLIALWLSAIAGSYVRIKLRPLADDQRDEFGVVQAAALTLLGLLIGFTFSMATSRYEQRKNYEEAEANAIGTEYVRADLLPDSQATRVRELLRSYLDQRILFYTARHESQLQQINATTAQLQSQLWSVVQARAASQATTLMALVVSGMNDVLNSQGYTQFAWNNRIPFEAWVLLAVIASGCNLLIGYGSHRTRTLLFLVVPLAVSISFFLIADIDSPRGGVIRVQPQNLLILAQSMQAH
ncbi:MAG TPA: hypothetical protein VKR57_10715 [Terriglobales bacterium]|nr:hypothetical protein [Terriglobales bacterium]